MATDEWKSVGPVVEGLKAMLLQKARSLVTSANRRPMLYCNGADGTPIRLTGTFMSSFDGNIVKRGEGLPRVSHPTMLHRDQGWPRRAHIGGHRPGLRALERRQGFLELLHSSNHMFPHMRELGALPITITSTCFD